MTAYNDFVVNGQSVQFCLSIFVAIQLQSMVLQPGLPKPFGILSHTASITTTY